MSLSLSHSFRKFLVLQVLPFGKPFNCQKALKGGMINDK
jgi:hypothetical protein